MPEQPTVHFVYLVVETPEMRAQKARERAVVRAFGVYWMRRELKALAGVFENAEAAHAHG